MIINRKVVIIHNIIAPYKVALFNELSKLIPNMEVVFIAEKEKRRDWNIDYTKIKFPYTLLFKGPIDSVSSVAIAKKTWRILEKIKPETSIICDYSNIFGWISLLWAKINKNNLIFWLASTFDDRKHFFPKEQIKHFFLKHFHLYLAPGEKTKQYLEYMKVESSKIIVTGYGVENDYYLQEYNKYKNQITTKTLKNISTNKNFLFVGRLSPEKNIISMLHAFSAVSHLDKNWGLIILGNGQQKEEIESYVLKNNLEDQIHTIGFVQQNEISKYYTLGDVFILPSISEPWGLVVNEAMLCSMPIIVSNRCGCEPELVEEGVNGFSFNPYDIHKLQLLMRGFIEDKYDIKLMGKESLRIVKQHSPENLASVISNKLNNLNFD